ncbi:MAG TPA: response regulator transcription factor [Candidatus Acidoferrales bacterium]|nr:response regulator transcription factor [Candidatus Acidoferrales bacterium]
MARPRVLLGDDHAMFCEGLRSILEPHFEVVGIVENGQELVTNAERLQPDVVVADISMPLLNGIGAARKLQKMKRSPKIVFLTMHADPTFATEAFRAGASGYVLKSSHGSEIVTAIQEAIQGRTHISAVIAGGVLGSLMENRTDQKKQAAELTPRQKEILQLIAEGKSPKEIAVVLNVSPRTVEFHKYRIMETTGVRTIAELTRYAVNHGII